MFFFLFFCTSCSVLTSYNFISLSWIECFPKHHVAIFILSESSLLCLGSYFIQTTDCVCDCSFSDLVHVSNIPENCNALQLKLSWVSWFLLFSYFRPGDFFWFGTATPAHGRSRYGFMARVQGDVPAHLASVLVKVLSVVMRVSGWCPWVRHTAHGGRRCRVMLRSVLL